jgi:hypothetical protein
MAFLGFLKTVFCFRITLDLGSFFVPEVFNFSRSALRVRITFGLGSLFVPGKEAFLKTTNLLDRKWVIRGIRVATAVAIVLSFRPYLCSFPSTPNKVIIMNLGIGRNSLMKLEVSSVEF